MPAPHASPSGSDSAAPPFDPTRVVPRGTGSNALSLRRIAAPVLLHARMILLVSGAVAIAVAAYSVVRPTRYRAELSFSTLTPNRASGLSGSLPAALLAAAGAGGLQASPALLSRLVRSQNVAVYVARMRVPEREERTVADLILERDAAALPDAVVARKLQSLVAASHDRETGLVTVVASHPDSGLARFLVQSVVGEVTTAFQKAVKAQASETSASLAERVTAAGKRLRESEERSRAFAARNRSVAPFSAAAIKGERLAADLTLAQTLYNQVRLERESARDRELESVPTVVVVDPIPRQLRPEPRGTVLNTALALVLSVGFLAAILILSDLARRGAMTPDEESENLAHALAQVPFARGIAARWRDGGLMARGR